MTIKLLTAFSRCLLKANKGLAERLAGAVKYPGLGAAGKYQLFQICRKAVERRRKRPYNSPKTGTASSLRATTVGGIAARQDLVLCYCQDNERRSVKGSLTTLLQLRSCP